jgi:hypothetical protein
MTNLPDACIDPAGITDDDVVAFALGEASELAVKHMELCPSCQAKADTFRQTALVLERDAHPPSLRIGELVQGLLSAQEELVLSAHLRTCKSCTSERALYVQLMSADPAPSPVERVVSGMKRLIAQQVAPSPTALGALRGDLANEAFSYRTESALVQLRVDRETQGRQRKLITGKLEARSGELAGSKASLFDGDSVLLTEEVDDDGYFFFPDIRPGTYRVEVRVDDVTSVIERFIVA